MKNIATRKLFFTLIIILVLFLSSGVHAFEVEPQDIPVYYEYWKVDSVGSMYTSYGTWSVATSGTGNIGSTLAYSATRSWSSTYSGTLILPASTISAAVGYSFTNSGSNTATYTYMYTANNQYAEIQIRNAYNTKKVVQRKWICDDDYHYPTSTTATVYPKGWSHFNFRVVTY